MKYKIKKGNKPNTIIISFDNGDSVVSEKTLRLLVEAQKSVSLDQRKGKDTITEKTYQESTFGEVEFNVK